MVLHGIPNGDPPIRLLRFCVRGVLDVGRRPETGQQFGEAHTIEFVVKKTFWNDGLNFCLPLLQNKGI